MPQRGKEKAQISVSITLPNGGTLDAADIALIETIRRCRSILGASGILGLSYRKTWLMADALNRTFEEKVFETHPGRRGGGGAEVTAFGVRLVMLFRSVERRSAGASAAALGELAAALDWRFEEKPAGKASTEEQKEPSNWGESKH